MYCDGEFTFAMAGGLKDLLTLRKWLECMELDKENKNNSLVDNIFNRAPLSTMLNVEADWRTFD